MSLTTRIVGVTGLVVFTSGLGVGSAASGAIGAVALLVFAVAATAEEFTAIQDRDRAKRLWDRAICASCGYDLARLPTDRCPECGTLRPAPTGAAPAS